MLSVLGWVAVATAQDTSIVPAANRLPWKPGVQGGIPVRSTVCATIAASTYGNGAQDASAGIQNAVQNCPAGQVVMLSAGTFKVNTLIQINKGITLRGAGPKATTLQKTNGAIAGQGNDNLADYQPVIVVGPNRWPRVNESTATNLTSNGNKGATSVTVGNASGFAAGQYVIVDADDYNTGSWIGLPRRSGSATNATMWASDRVVFMRHNPPDAVDDPFPDSLGWFSRSARPVNEIKEIASVSGNTINFTTPLYIDYPTSKGAQIVRYADTHVKYAGVEEMKLTGGSDGQLRFECAAESWTRNIENTVWIGEGVAVNNSFHVEVRDSYIHDAAYSVPGGIAYAVSMANASSDILLENNIILKANKVMVARSSGAGSVVGYNYVDDGLIEYALTFHEVGLNASHMVGSHHVLFEGNEGFNYDSDDTHGSAIYMTIFRNHLTGFRRTVPGGDNARAAGLNFGSWWHVFIGNVMGNPGQMGGWIYEQLGTNSNPNDPFGGAPPIWKLGYQSGQWDQSADPKVLSTVIRDGNFDYVTNSVRWDRGAQALPPSLYLTSKPAFFGSNPWPWVDPTGTTKLAVLPARQRYDTGGGVIVSTPPTAPSGLRIIK